MNIDNGKFFATLDEVEDFFETLKCPKDMVVPVIAYWLYLVHLDLSKAEGGKPFVVRFGDNGALKFQVINPDHPEWDGICNVAYDDEPPARMH